VTADVFQSVHTVTDSERVIRFCAFRAAEFLDYAEVEKLADEFPDWVHYASVVFDWLLVPRSRHGSLAK
jgi:hypothetical protein